MQEDYYIQLLYQQLTGEISQEDAQQLAQWRQAKPENEREARSVELAWSATGPAADSGQVNLDTAFAELEKRMDSDKKEPTKIRSLPQRKRFNWAMAASIAALVCLGLFFWLQPEQETTVTWAEVATQDEIRSILLADQTEVTLNKNSRLSYPSEFSKTERRVKLEGEAFFEVTHQPEQPFIVATSQEEVTVLGTSFNVNAREQDGIAVYVQEGRVGVNSLTKPQKQIILQAGEAARSIRDSGEVIKEVNASTNTLGWVKRELVLSGIAMNEVSRLLLQQFNIIMDLAETDIATCTIDNTFKVDQPEQFFSDLETLFGTQVRHDGNRTYLLVGGHCNQ